MNRTLLPASQRRPAHQAFAEALCPGGGSAKDAATQIYTLLQAAETLYHAVSPDAATAGLTSSSQHHIATQIIGHGHIIAHNLEALRELGRGLK